MVNRQHLPREMLAIRQHLPIDNISRLTTSPITYTPNSYLTTHLYPVPVHRPIMSLNVPGPRLANPSLHNLQLRGSMSRLVSSSKSLLATQPSFISGAQSLYQTDHLTPLEACLAATLFSECIHQIALLLNILPRPSGIDGKSHSVQPLVDKVLGPQLAEIMSVQDKLDSEYDKLLEARDRDAIGNCPQKTALQGIFSQLGSRRSYPDQSLSLTAVHTAENQAKLIQECQFLLDTMETLELELSSDGHYASLIASVRRAGEEKGRIRDVVQKEQDCRMEVRKLQDTLLTIRRQHEEEACLCREGIAHCKDQIQEIKQLSSRDIKYIKKSCQLETAMHSKAAKFEEEILGSTVEKRQDDSCNEERVNRDIERFLKGSTDGLQDKLEYWMNKFETDSEEKSNELRDVEDKLAVCLGKMQEQSKKYQEYHKVVEDNRLEKEQIRLMEERDKRELYATIQLQAWWRGTMQRNLLGPFRPKKSKKGGGKKKGEKKKKKN